MSKVTFVPTELWSDIITLACTDFGITARSLALTSKFLHAQTLACPGRCQSVALTSLARVERFLECLRIQPTDVKPRIEHLFLSFADEPFPIKHPDNFWRVCSKWSEARREEHNRMCLVEMRKWGSRFCVAMSELTALVTSTVRTMCILITPVGWPSQFFASYIFPKLEELTIEGYIDLAAREDSIEQTELEQTLDPTCRFPVLQRLHHVLAFPSVETVLGLPTIAPSSLTHFRLSHVSYDHRSLPGALASVLDVDSSKQGGISGERTLENLHHVVVHGYGPSPVGKFCRALGLEWKSLHDSLLLVSRKCKEIRGLNVVVLSRPFRRNPRWKDRLYADWLDRISGGRGCWVSSDEEEAELEVFENDPLPKSLHDPRFDDDDSDDDDNYSDHDDDIDDDGNDDDDNGDGDGL